MNSVESSRPLRLSAIQSAWFASGARLSWASRTRGTPAQSGFTSVRGHALMHSLDRCRVNVRSTGTWPRDHAPASPGGQSPSIHVSGTWNDYPGRAAGRVCVCIELKSRVDESHGNVLVAFSGFAATCRGTWQSLRGVFERRVDVTGVVHVSSRWWWDVTSLDFSLLCAMDGRSLTCRSTAAVQQKLTFRRLDDVPV